jgi:hypothetical protein
MQDASNGYDEYVNADFARQLERELIEVTKDRDYWKEATGKAEARELNNLRDKENLQKLVDDLILQKDERRKDAARLDFLTNLPKGKLDRLLACHFNGELRRDVDEAMGPLDQYERDGNRGHFDG